MDEIKVVPYIPDEDYDNPAMVVDFYEFTMANCLFLHGFKNTTLVFDMFFRKNPDNMGYSISAGQRKLTRFLLNYHFNEQDIRWLRTKGMSEEFCEYLRTYKWKGDMYALPEGTVCYPHVQMVRIECDLVGAILIETYLLQTMNFHSLITTKATRVTGLNTHTPRSVMEFGTRRAQGESAGNDGAYAAVLGGCIGTANCLAEMKYGSEVKAVGTVAHSFIEFFPTEFDAFKAFADTYPDSVSLLLDTYNIMESGLPNLIKLDDYLIEKYPNDPNRRVKSARIDSGDLARGSKRLRKALDAAGKSYIKLVASNGLDEKKIANMGAMGMLGVDVEGKTVETGDGLRMGAWIGAKVQDFHAPMTHHMGSGMGVTPFLQINKRGDRFMNECIPGQQLENQIELQPECTSFQLYDSKWGEEVPYMPANHGGLCYIIPEDEDESNPNYTDRQYTKISAKAEAYQFKADTLEDLLTQCGFEGDALDNALASVERYNELAKAGSDDDFGKPASRMFALENPPYYACQWGTTSMLVCVGGLESDENCHTFTEEDPASPKRDIIKGLYVCGNVQGSRYAVEYPICMRGISHSLCVYYGYIAGKNCVAGV